MNSKITLGLIILLAAAVVYLFVKVGSLKNTADADAEIYLDTAAKSFVPGQGSVVAYVLGDSINANYRFITEKEDELIASTKSSEAKIEREISQAQARYMELMGKAESGGFGTQEEVARAEEELAELDRRIQELQSSESERNAQLADELQKEFFDRVHKFLKSYAAQRGIDVVLNLQPGGIMLYGNDSQDITSEVIRGLNAEYEAEKKQLADK
jgi:outer membrane protein